jgi:hypothetical protein
MASRLTNYQVDHLATVLLSSSRLNDAQTRTAKKKVKSISIIGCIARENIPRKAPQRALVKIWLIRSAERY